MTSDLDEIIAEVAADLAHSHGLPLDTAKRMVRRRLDEAWAEYQDAGAPYGVNGVELIRWIAMRPKQPPTV